MNHKRILLVDDEPELVEIVKMRLEANKFKVLTASDGQEALKKARTEKPDLIILDLMLPYVNGHKVCRLLKFDSRYKHIPIIIFTAKASEADREAAREVMADDYITKPFEPDILLKKINKLIN